MSVGSTELTKERRRGSAGAASGPCEHAPTAWLTDSAAACHAAPAALPHQLALDRLLPDPAGDQLLDRLARNAAGGADPGPVQPVLPRPDPRGRRRLDHLEGDGDPGDVQEVDELRGLEVVDELQHRDSGVRRHEVALEPARAEGRRRQRQAVDRKRRVVGEPPARLRPDAPLHRAAGSADAPCGQRAGGARQLRPLARQALRADRGPRDLRRRGRDRRGEGRALRGGRLPAPAGEVPEARGADPARRAALRAAGNREDAARARGRRRGERAVLLPVGVRVRRGDRRHRRSARPRPLRAGEDGGAGDRVHRRAGCDRPLAHLGRGRVQRRQRRARADPEPDPHRDGRLHSHHQRDRDRGDQPPGRARPGAPATRAVRPPGCRAASRPDRPRGDPEGAHTLACRSGPMSTSAALRRAHPGWSVPTWRTSSTRRRSSPRAAATSRCWRPISPTRSSGSFSAPSAR